MTAALARRPPRTMLYQGRGAVSGRADVYRARDGVGVVVVGEGVAVKQTPHGPVRVTGKVVVELPSVAAFDHWKRVAFHRDPALYAKTVGVLGLDDDARNAPPIPEGLLTSGPLIGAGAGAGAQFPALQLAVSGGEPVDAMVSVAGLAERPIAVAAEVDGVPTLAELLGAVDPGGHGGRR